MYRETSLKLEYLSSLYYFFTISGNFITGYSVSLCSVGWLNSRELILVFKLCKTFSQMVLWHRGYKLKM